MESETAQAPSEEQLPRMSFGDHLDELRRRLLIALAAVFVCILGMLPFKNRVTAIYTAPYVDMWMKSFEAHCDEVDALKKEIEEAGGMDVYFAGDPLSRQWREAQFAFIEQCKDQILNDTFPEEFFEKIQSVGMFPLPRTLTALGGLDDFWTFLSASLLFALIIASPVVLYQIWAFIAAGLYKKERQVVMKYMPLGLGLFATGVLFGYLVVVPWGLFFLIKLMNWAQVTSMMSVSIYFSFLFTLTTALGIVFQLPLVMVALQKVGLVSHEAMRKHWRVVIVCCFALSAVFTPPDPFTQVMMAGPMVLLYLVGLFMTSRRKGGDPVAAVTE